MPTITTKTISQSGTPDYSTPELWEADKPVNLVTSDIVWRGVIQSASDNFSTGASTALTITGSTTDATRYAELDVADGASYLDHASPVLRFDATKGASIQTTSATAIVIAENYAKVKRVQIKSTTAGQQISTDSSATGVKLDSVLGDSNNSNGNFAGTTPTIVNCTFINRTGAQASLATVTGASQKSFINCLFGVPSDLTANTRAIFLSSSGNGHFTNCAFMNCSSTAIHFGTGTITFVTCAADNATPPTGVTNISIANAAFVEPTNTNTDFRITEDSLFIDAGTTSATHAADDPFGTARPEGAAYDIGPHEYTAPVSGGGSAGINLLLLGVG